MNTYNIYVHEEIIKKKDLPDIPSYLELRTITTNLLVLRFYGPVNSMGSCRARSVYLTTRLLGRLSPLSG